MSSTDIKKPQTRAAADIGGEPGGAYELEERSAKAHPIEQQIEEEPVFRSRLRLIAVLAGINVSS